MKMEATNWIKETAREMTRTNCEIVVSNASTDTVSATLFDWDAGKRIDLEMTREHAAAIAQSLLSSLERDLRHE